VHGLRCTRHALALHLGMSNAMEVVSSGVPNNGLQPAKARPRRTNSRYSTRPRTVVISCEELRVRGLGVGHVSAGLRG
jgi:hypothetical protein